jgi:hypothetical protein
MKTGMDDTPVIEINDYTYYVFEEIEKRGLQFALPNAWKPIYREFLRMRKQYRREIREYWSQSGSYQDDFGDKGAAVREEDSKTNSPTRPLEE